MSEESVSSRVDASERPPRRQAIILIHGMGEQMPMETVRDFAEAVWANDRDIHDPASPANNPGELFFVPDPNSGSRELRRISTRRSRPRHDAQNSYQVRNEFFELYWADSTNDTTWRDFLLWYVRLVLRCPADVPHQVMYIWVLLWTVNIAFVLAAEVAALWLVPTELVRVTSLAEFATPTVVATLKILVWALVATFIGWVGGKLVLPKWVGVWISGIGLFVAIWCVVVVVGLVLKGTLKDAYGQHQVFWAGFMTLVSVILLLLQGFLIRFFGDVARYTIASPGNIAPRQKVRDRGLALLKQLSATGRYDRVVVVAHSLGCLIAYDLVNLLWADYVSTINKDQAMVPAAVPGSPLEMAIENVCAAATAEPFNLVAFRKAQRAFFHELRDADVKRINGRRFKPDDAVARWLISDLVTIACPLTHAEFLLARTSRDLDGRFDRRELATCPPTPERDASGSDEAGRLTFEKDKDRPKRFLHDATFAGVRWTNIHDAPRNRFFFLLGDCIAGPVGALFGLRRANHPRSAESARGVVDIHVRPTWPPGPLPPRLFTHTIYWSLHQSVDGDAAPASVQVVRNAINVLDEEATEAKLIAAMG